MSSLQAGRRPRCLSWPGLLISGALACAPARTGPAGQLPASPPTAPASPTNSPTSEAKPSAREAEPTAKPPATVETAQAAPPAPRFDDNLDEDIAEITASLAPEGSPAPSSVPLDSPSSADTEQAPPRPPILYRVRPTGLVIEVDGLHFRPQASAHRRRNGTYSLQLALTAESFDGRTYQVRTGAEGPLSIAGTVTEANGSKFRFSDTRRSGSQTEVAYGEKVLFEQSWPGQEQPQLRSGQRVKLEVGLWGTSAEEARERPVRRLFTVEFEARRGATPAIEPPALDWGQ